MKLNALAKIALVAGRQQRIDHSVARKQSQALLGPNLTNLTSFMLHSALML